MYGRICLNGTPSHLAAQRHADSTAVELSTSVPSRSSKRALAPMEMPVRCPLALTADTSPPIKFMQHAGEQEDVSHRNEAECTARYCPFRVFHGPKQGIGHVGESGVSGVVDACRGG